MSNVVILSPSFSYASLKLLKLTVYFIARYLIAFILLWKLNDEVMLISPNIDGGRVVRYLKSGKSLIKKDSFSFIE